MFTRLKKLPVIGFFARYWLLLVFLVPSVWAYTTNNADGWLFKTFGPGVYHPGLCFEAAVFFLLFRHLWLNRTADADAASGQYERDWRNVDPHVRIYATVALTIGILFSFAYIIGSNGK